MAREIVKQLEGRERELVGYAAAEVRVAVGRIEQAKADGLLREQHFNALLEMALSQGDTEGLTYDLTTGEIYRENPEEES